MKEALLIKYIGSDWQIQEGYFRICPRCNVSSEHYIKIGKKERRGKVERLCTLCYNTYFGRC